jgi:hypothetical protein
MLNFCGIVAAILKMAIGRNFSMSGIFQNDCQNMALKMGGKNSTFFDIINI